MGGFSGALGTLAVNLIANVDEYLTDIAAVADTTDKAIDAMEKKFEGLQNVGSQLTGLGASLTAALTLPIAGLAALSVQAAGDFDSLMRGLTAVAGSSAEAEKQMARLKEVAKLPGLGLEEAVQGSIRLQAVGVSATEAERQMMAFGNALATVGKGKADLDGVIAQLVQMSSKTKVVAEDLKPIMERVPQAATIIKEAYGTIDTEVIQKMGVGTQELINTVVGGLEKLPKVSGGIKNAFENLGDSLNQALVKIGNLFVPLIEKVTPMIEGLVAGIGKLAEWFSELPAPVQAAVGGVVAFAAALGPVIAAIGGITMAIGAAMPALTAMAGFFGVSVAALAPWALAIAGITAALAALGAWVYENWDPIVAVLTQAWAGIAEAWTAAWNKVIGAVTGIWNGYASTVKSFWTPVINFFLGIWDKVAPYFVAVWDAIRGALTTVWNGILDTANKVWGAITGAFQKFIEWASKIPGVSKLMTLTEAWEGAKRLNAEVEKTNVVLPKATANVAAFGNETKKTADKIKPVAFNINSLEQAIKDEQAALLKGHADFLKWSAAHKDAESQIPKVTEVSEELNASITRIIGTMKNLPPAFLNAEAQAKASMQGAVDSVKKVEDAFKTLGIQSTATLDEQARKATEAYETIRDNVGSSIGDIQRAWVAMEEANIAVSKAAGETISQERLNALEKMKAGLEQHLTKQKTEWEKFLEGVKQIVRGLQADIAHGLSGALWDFSGRSDFNKDLDKQAEDLRGSLAKQTTDWEKYQADTLAGMERLTGDHQAELAKMEADYRDSLASREADYADYAKEVASNVEDIKTTHAKELEEESGRLRDALDEKESDYADHVDDVNRRMEEIRENYAEKLEQETQDLRDSLRDRLEQYQDFVADANNKMQRLGDDTQTNIERETKDTASNIADRQRDYDRYAEDAADKIAGVRAKNKGVYSQEEADLQRSLRRKKEDLDSYVAEQNRKLQEYIDDQKKRQAREEQDNKDSLDRKARDYDEFVTENKAKQDQAYTDYKTGLERDLGEQQINLNRRTEDMEKFRIDTAGKLEALTVKHQEEQDKEILAQETSLTKKRTALDTYNADAAAKYENDRANAEAKYTEQLADLNQSLTDKKAAYDQYVIDTNTKLDEIATKHRTVWGDIKDNMIDAFKGAGESLTAFVTDILVGKLFKQLGNLVDDILPGVGKAMSGAFGGAAGGAGSAAGGVGSAAGSVGGGGAGSAASGVVGGAVGGWVSLVSGAVSAVSGVISNFQFAAMNKSLDLIEHNTRYSMMFLGERGDGGIVDATLKTSEKLNYVNASLDDLRAKMDAYMEPMKNDTHSIMERFSFAQNRLDEISSNTYWGLTATQDNATLLSQIRDMLERPPASNWTVTFVGDPIAKMVGDQIMAQLRVQGVNLTPGKA